MTKKSDPSVFFIRTTLLLLATTSVQNLSYAETVTEMSTDGEVFDENSFLPAELKDEIKCETIGGGGTALTSGNTSSTTVRPSNGLTKCPKRCFSDRDCLNDRKLCLCDQECGMSCIRPEKECPELPDPPNGQVHLSGRHFTDQAVYTCNEDYQLIGLDKTYCKSDGSWSIGQPICRQGSSGSNSRYYCGKPKDISNAIHNGTKEQQYYNLDSILSYSCLSGYKRKGFQESQCFYFNNSARWFGPDLQCNPIECGKPKEILNGDSRGECTTYRCQTDYYCMAGFQLVGKSSRYCQGDGTWTPSELPSCVPVQCPVPNSPMFGKAMFTTVAYQSVVTYECEYGYMIVGNATRTCEQNKMWSGSHPTCEEIDCGNPGFLANGWLGGSQTNLHAIVTFHCNPNMIFEGSSRQTTCQANGKWSHDLPRCHSSCSIPHMERGKTFEATTENSSDEVKEDDDPEMSVNDTELISAWPGSNVAHGVKIIVKCEPQYEIEGRNKSEFACTNGTFVNMTDCRPARCKTLPKAPRNGMVLMTSTSHGSLGLVRCNDGFRLQGSNTTTCSFGEWIFDPLTHCQIIYCPFPGYIKNGKVLLVGNMGLYDYRPYVRKVKNNRQILFECVRGFRLDEGPSGATCVDGKWSPSALPNCVQKSHPIVARWQK